MPEGWVEFLGTGGGAPRPDARPPGILLFYHGMHVLLDAGEGVQIRLIERGVGPGRLDLVALTHAHGDHVFGLPGLVQSMSLHSRQRPLTIMGPPSVRELLDVTFRVTGFTPTFELSFVDPLEEVRLTSGKALLSVKGFKTCHTEESYGYVLTGYKATGEGLARRFTVAYTGDTAPCEKVEEALIALGPVDLLVHDSTFSATRYKEAKEYGHSTAVDAALLAKRLDVKALVLFHVSSRYRDRQGSVLAEAREVFERTYLAFDGMRLLVA